MSTLALIADRSEMGGGRTFAPFRPRRGQRPCAAMTRHVQQDLLAEVGA